MYIITLIDEGFLERSTFAKTEAKMLEIVEKWHGANYSERNDEGYIAVETVDEEGEIAKRQFQIDLDQEPGTF